AGSRQCRVSTRPSRFSFTTTADSCGELTGGTRSRISVGDRTHKLRRHALARPNGMTRTTACCQQCRMSMRAALAGDLERRASDFAAPAPSRGRDCDKTKPPATYKELPNEIPAHLTRRGFSLAVRQSCDRILLVIHAVYGKSGRGEPRRATSLAPAGERLYETRPASRNGRGLVVQSRA